MGHSPAFLGNFGILALSLSLLAACAGSSQDGSSPLDNRSGAIGGQNSHAQEARLLANLMMRRSAPKDRSTTIQNLTANHLEKGLTAYLTFQLRAQQLEVLNEIVKNILLQLHLEDSRIGKEKLAIDLILAKSILAEAELQRIAGQQQLHQAWRLFRDTFGTTPPVVPLFDLAPVPDVKLKSLMREHFRSKPHSPKVEFEISTYFNAKDRADHFSNEVRLKTAMFKGRLSLKMSGRETTMNVLEAETDQMRGQVKKLEADMKHTLAGYKILRLAGKLTPEVVLKQLKQAQKTSTP